VGTLIKAMIKNINKILFFLCLISFTASHPAGAAATLLFKSGFEADVKINGQNQGAWPERILGLDSNTGYTWETDMPGNASANMFNYLVGSGNTVDDYVISNIETTIGPHGTPTKVLYHKVIANDLATGPTSRSQYNVYPGGSTPTDKLERIYARYWTKFDSDLPSSSSWRLIMEWLNGDYRWGIYIYQDANGPYWHIKGQLLPEKTTPWSVSNHDIAVPIDEWFLLEVFWNHSTGADGRVWVAVNGKTIADYNGPLKRVNGIGAWCIFKNYGSLGVGGQWIDDVEIWDDIPIATSVPPAPPSGLKFK